MFYNTLNFKILKIRCCNLSKVIRVQLPIIPLSYAVPKYIQKAA